MRGKVTSLSLTGCVPQEFSVNNARLAGGVLPSYFFQFVLVFFLIVTLSKVRSGTQQRFVE